MEKIEIIKADSESKISLEEINDLLRQLSKEEITFGSTEFENLVTSSGSELYLLYKEGALAGMLTLCSYLCPTGRKYWIEDVVVDKDCRGLGLGRRLIDFAIEETRKRGKSSLMLTSRPSRVEANRLYQSSGFEKRETNVYRMKFK